MQRQQNVLGDAPFGESAIIDDIRDVEEQASMAKTRSPLTKTRSMSDGGGTPSKLLSPSPHIIEVSRQTSKDDSNLGDVFTPVTPRCRRPNFPLTRGGGEGDPSLQMPPRGFTPPATTNSLYVKPAPLSPKLDHSQIYASPTNILPRRSRGLDFSRAATSLHHSTLAEQSSPDSSPTGGGRAMNIPNRRHDIGGPEQTSTSLWSVMGNHDRMHTHTISGSLGSSYAMGSDSSSSSDDDDLMDEDMEESYVTTPQVSKMRSSMGQSSVPGPFGSPAMSSLMSFQQRQRPRKQHKKKVRGSFGLGFNSTAANLSKSPPSNRARRESISWQANQLYISGADADENVRSLGDVDGIEGQRGVTRRVVGYRRGNLMPKSKGFARIKAALFEEGAPAEAETRREAEVVKQVWECDTDLEPRIPPPVPAALQGRLATAPPSPNTTIQDPLDDVAEEDMMGDISMGLSSSFKQHAMRNSKGKIFWDTFSETSSVCGARTTPPPPSALPRGSSSGMSEDINMDSPSLGGPPGYLLRYSSNSRATSLNRADTPQNNSNAMSGPQPPSAAEITRRINNKRRRDDDFDPVSFKRRAVSPGMSVHNSPITQSPLQRDIAPWSSRPGSNGGDKAGSSAPSETGSMGTSGSQATNSNGRVGSKGRIGFQGMVDTNDGIMRMSIE